SNGRPNGASAQMQGKPCIGPCDEESCREESEKNSGFRGDSRPEDLRIADRGEPHRVDEEVAKQSKQDQANCAGDANNDQPWQDVTPPWCLLFGPGNPDRHGEYYSRAEGLAASRATCFLQAALLHQHSRRT